MKAIFKGKDNKPHLVSELELGKILKNQELLSNYSMLELDELYKKHFGDYIYAYPYILEGKIKCYDTSSEVNGFYLNEKEYWLDKNTRMGLAHLADCTEGNMSLVLGDTIIEADSTIIKDLLSQLEQYAAKCYVTTAKHLSAVKELKTVDEIINYDYTSGYPDKLKFNI